MTKKIFIEGMSCNHCVRHVQEALQELSAVKEVSVNLNEKHALVHLNGDVEDSALKNAIEDAGYDVVSIVNV
jgi:copper ion binding protein